MNAPARSLAAFACLLLAGCSTSLWEKAYAPAASAPALHAEAPVQIREVPWDRLMDARRDLESRAAASDVHPDEWPAERRAEAQAILLRALQVSEAPESVTILGRSDFRAVAALRPETPGGGEELARLARSVGADRVVWSRRLLGKAEAIVQEPVSTFSTGTDWRGARGKRDHGFSSWQSTTWVPVVVAADEYAYVAYFLRVK